MRMWKPKTIICTARQLDAELAWTDDDGMSLETYEIYPLCKLNFFLWHCKQGSELNLFTLCLSVLFSPLSSFSSIKLRSYPWHAVAASQGWRTITAFLQLKWLSVSKCLRFCVCVNSAALYQCFAKHQFLSVQTAWLSELMSFILQNCVISAILFAQYQRERFIFYFFVHGNGRKKEGREK